MHSLYTITSGKSKFGEALSLSEELSVYYHDLFDFPLTFADLIKWNCLGDFPQKRRKIPTIYQNGYYFLQGRESLVYKRVLRSRISAKKMEIAKKASEVLSLIPSINMIAVTGSLAMINADDESDIDLMVITKKGTLWTTRMSVYFLLSLLHFPLRHAADKRQKDRLCLNLWMDEADLVWKPNDRNLYTAHEIAQILPIVNKNEAYEKFLYKNKWILKFWPNAVRVSGGRQMKSGKAFSLSVTEKFAYRIQYQHMKSKITREVITPTRAIFHPQDLGKITILRLGS